jgi:acetolactate synthase-1/2/3 large subunit
MAKAKQKKVKSAQKAKPKARTGAAIFRETLEAEGVDTIFGYPGGVVLPIFDELYNSMDKFVLTRHEQGAAHAADGYARSTGKVGVVLATSGPGACNLITGLATAHMDSIPIVAFTGQVKTTLIGNDAFQEADVTGITRPVTKYNILVKDVKDLARTIHEAFHVARTGRPGPVLVDIPFDVSMAELTGTPDKQMQLPGYKPQLFGNPRQIAAAAKAINAAERPVIYAGGGVILANASDLLRELAAKANVPVTTTLLALGAFDQENPLSLNMLGMHGTAYANFAAQDCDLLVAIGARFEDRVTGNLAKFAPKAKIIHIDVDPSSIAKNVKVDIPVVGDARNILEELVKLVECRPRSAWIDQIGKWKKQYPLTYDRKAGCIKPQYVIEQICEATKGEAIVATGVGQHQMWTAQFFRWSFPRQIISSGGLGTMGFGLPSANGAQRGNPDKVVISIDGDGSFCMTMQELITSVNYSLPIKSMILNNGYLGMVRQWQELFFGKRYSATPIKSPDFAAFAESVGATGMVVTEKSQVRKAIEQSLATDGPAVIDFHVDPEENVWPMVPAGKSLHEMKMGPLA